MVIPLTAPEPEVRATVQVLVPVPPEEEKAVDVVAVP